MNGSVSRAASRMGLLAPSTRTAFQMEWRTTDPRFAPGPYRWTTPPLKTRAEAEALRDRLNAADGPLGDTYSVVEVEGL